MDEASETPFYQDEGISTHIMSPYLFDKSSLHLNLETMVCEPKLGEIKRNGTPSGLRSPDLGLLKLGSPELEKMIMSLQSNGAASSTPSSIFNTNVNATVNSEHIHEHVTYTRGFADALQDLHDRQATGEKHSLIELADNTVGSGDPFLGHNSAGGSVAFIGTHPLSTVRTTSEVASFSSGLTRSDTSDYYTSAGSSYPTSKGSGIYPSYSSSNAGSGFSSLYAAYPSENAYVSENAPPYHNYEMEKSATLRAYTSYNSALAQHKAEMTPPFKFEGQTTQFIEGDHGSLQPIDLEVQEVVKRERKKQRNRVASSKCRKRKLEREARLEVRVKDLKERNIELNAVANALKQQVCDLKQRVMDHVSEGCQIMLAHQSQM